MFLPSEIIAVTRQSAQRRSFGRQPWRLQIRCDRFINMHDRRGENHCHGRQQRRRQGDRRGTGRRWSQRPDRLPHHPQSASKPRPPWPATLQVAHLDLADLASVRKFADSVDGVDVLINNAGVLGLPLTRTADGFEAHMGTNYLGHFALTCLLGDRIKDRVISVVSSAYALSRLHIDDLNWHTRKYSKWAAYGESKLAIMLFSRELVTARGTDLHDRSGCDGYRHHQGHHRCAAVGA